MRHGVLCSSFVILLVLLSLVTAIPNTPYIVVLGASAPASDAVEGANYAASMKAATGVTFTSQLEITTVESPEKFYVWIDGRAKTVRISGMDDARVEENTRAYFSKKGWTVLAGAPPVTPPEKEEPPGDETDAAQESAETREPPPADPPDAGDIAVTPENDEAPAATQDANEQDALQAEQEAPRPNVLVRAWRWLAGLFS